MLVVRGIQNTSWSPTVDQAEAGAQHIGRHGLHDFLLSLLRKIRDLHARRATNLNSFFDGSIWIYMQRMSIACPLTHELADTRA